MKKYLCLFLAILMILSLCACSGSDAAKETTAATEATVEEAKPQLEIGYGKVNITPSYSVGLSSSGDEKNRRSTGLISYVFATCIAVRFGEDTYLMYTVDTISMPEELMKILRETISSVVPEVKPENIFLAATHTHSAPANAIADNEAEGKYRIDFINYIPQAAKLAIKDLTPATMSACKFDLEGMNFVRHYWAIDGSSAGNNYGNQNIEYKEHTYDVNHEMMLVKFERGEKDDVLLVNWAAHPANGYDEAIGYYNISADHPGWCRDELERLIGDGTKVAYFNGASGDGAAVCLDIYVQLYVMLAAVIVEDITHDGALIKLNKGIALEDFQIHMRKIFSDIGGGDIVKRVSLVQNNGHFHRREIYVLKIGIFLSVR